MPAYSLTRTSTSRYETVAQLETKSFQDSFTWDGNDGASYHSSFTATLTTVCPTANRTWNYFTAASPVAAYVWYPYSLTMACSGGDPGTGDLPGYAYFKLYSSAGGYLMGSSPGVPASPLVPASSIPVYNSLANGGNIAGGASVQATGFIFNTSRNTLTMTADTGYVAGFTNVYTSTVFNTIFARSLQSTTVNQDLYTSSAELATSSVSLTLRNADYSIMGYVSYSCAPVKPVTANLEFITTPFGIKVTYRGNEVDSMTTNTASIVSTTTVGIVNQIMFFFSETLAGPYEYLATRTNITRTLVSSTSANPSNPAPTGQTAIITSAIFEYTGDISGNYLNTITVGKKYFFKVASVNDCCTAYQAESSATRIIAGEQSEPVYVQYGHAQFIKIRNFTDTTWVYPIDSTTLQPTHVYIRDSTNTTWINGEINIRNQANNGWILN